MKAKRFFVLFAMVTLAAGIGLDCNGDGNGDNSDGGDSEVNYDYSNWYIYTVDSEGDTGICPSITVDSKDRPHIAYFSYALKYPKDGGDYEEYVYYLKYAKKTATGWEFSVVEDHELIEEAGYVANCDSDIAVDSKGSAHVSYAIDHNGYYVTNTSGSWRRLYSTFGARCSSVEVDSQGKVHILYDDYYVTNSSGEWREYSIDIGGTFSDSSMKLDKKGNVHTVFSTYYWGNTKEIKYITNASGEWKVIAVDAYDFSSSWLREPSIAVDSNSKIHISYKVMTRQPSSDVDFVKYLTNSAGNWEVFTIDSSYDIDDCSTIALSSDNSAHVIYHYYNNYPERQKGTKYATNRGGNWNIFMTPFYDGDYFSLAIDSKGFAHIAYFALFSDDLMYATNRKPE